MSGFRIQGSVSGHVAEVTEDNEIKVSQTQDLNKAGFTALVTSSDEGEITGSVYRIPPESSTDYKLRVGLDTLVMNEFFPGVVLNSGVWTAPTTTSTITVANGFATLNAGLSTASSAVARLSSYRTFPVFGAVKTYFECVVSFAQLPLANNVCEWGMGIATALVAPTDGAFFRLNALGEFKAVVTNNGTEIQSESIDFVELVGNNVTNDFVISIGTGSVQFWINDVLVASTNLSVAGGNTISSCALPIFFRQFNSGITSAAQAMKISNVNITFGDNNYTKLYHHQAAGNQWNSSVTQTGVASVQTAVWANGANPAAGTPSATSAALGSGLGGICIANINGLAAVTDFIISSYQVPIGTAILPGKCLYVTGIRVSSVNMVVANGASITTWAMALAYGHTSVSLATTESATAKAPRRIPLGIQSLGAAAAIGQPASPDINYVMTTPVVVQPGEFVQTILRFVTNGSAATQAVNFYITIEGYFE